MKCIKFIEISNYYAFFNWIKLYRKFNDKCIGCGKTRKEHDN